MLKIIFLLNDWFKDVINSNMEVNFELYFNYCSVH